MLPDLVCPNGCGRRYSPVHRSDEVLHSCPKAKDKNHRIVMLVPEPPPSQTKEDES